MKYMVTIRRDDAHGESVTCAVVGAVDVPALLAELSNVARFALTTDVSVHEWLADVAEGDVLTITIESAAASAARGARALKYGERTAADDPKVGCIRQTIRDSLASYDDVGKAAYDAAREARLIGATDAQLRSAMVDCKLPERT